jgi:serine/threonine protein kinase
LKGVVRMTTPDQIGRFQVVEELGRGSQGVVYLASDPQLEREVAIKTLQLDFSLNSQKQQRLLKEARTVSKLQHPNIIPLYEVGDFEEKPYLVFEFVDGVTLRALVKKEGALPAHRAIKLMCQILEGVAYAHQRGVVHRDLSPANILVSQEDVPRIMDFGISVMTHAENISERGVSGTMRYMSPEQFSKQTIGPQSDIFVLGLILFEMLVGQPAINEENHFAALYKIAHEPITPPSMMNPDLEKGLDAIVLRAVAKDTKARYADALEMKADLDDYLAVDAVQEPDQAFLDQGHSTLEFLLRRIRQRSDLPSFGRIIVEINKRASLSATRGASAPELAELILKDVALTSKLLKTANSANHGYAAGSVATVSKAIVTLGLEQVRLAANGLVPFGHLPNKAQASALRDAAIASYMGGTIARDLADRLGYRETEAAFICAMLRNLGRHLALFYFPDESGQIANLVIQKGIDEHSASRSVLGISYEDLGVGIAKSWKLPETIVRCMRSLPKGKFDKPKSEDDFLAGLAVFSNELGGIALVARGPADKRRLKTLLERFQKCIRIPEKQLLAVLKSAHEGLRAYSDVLDLSVEKSRIPGRLAEVPPTSQVGKRDDTSTSNGAVDNRAAVAPSVTAGSEDQHDPVIRGIKEITSTLLDDFEFNDLMTMILETMYQGFGFNRVLFCTTDKYRTRMIARYGFGKDIEKIVEDFGFRMNASSGVFNLALAKATDFSIENANEEGIRKGIPKWFNDVVTAQAFVLYPIIVKKVPMGLIYADQEHRGKMLTERQSDLMKILCNQAALALRQTAR